MTMDRLKSWIDQSPTERVYRRSVSDSYRPPTVIQTDNTYDDDESFTLASLNLFSKHEYLSLTPRDAINSTLVFPLERSMYLDALYIRKGRACHLSPSTKELIQSVEKVFGVELKKIVDRESCMTNPHNGAKFFHLSTSRPPSTPCREKNRKSFCFGDAAFFGGCKVAPLDWKLAEAIEQVQSLRLDGTSAPVASGYTPPTQLGRIPI
jgi:hypothetical protein